MINKKEMISERVKISYLEIFLLIVSVFAFSYIVSAPSVSAQTEKLCCPKTNDGAICQDLDYDACEDSCEESCLPTACEDTSLCKLGCCYDSENGLCSPNSPQQRCENWYEDPGCGILECRKGCCFLGQETEYVTERRCEVLSSFYNFQYSYDSSLSELECLAQSEVQVKGACIIESEEEKTCKFGTELECLRLTGSSSNFYENKLCTNSGLNVSCLSTNEKTCVEGKDEVYFVDSCGNVANVYDSSKINDEDYWQEVVSKENSCGAGNANIEDEDCGNCDYLLGSLCENVGGNYICKDLNCDDAPYVIDPFGEIQKTLDREQGESWCVYDGSVGNATDIVGSRHFRYYCLDGEIKSGPCSDLRQEVCGKVIIEGQETNESDVVEKAESVGCVGNRWRECVKVTADLYFENTDDFKAQKELFKNLAKDSKVVEEFKAKCEENDFCTYYEMELKKTPLIPVCMPRFPTGLEFYEYENVTEAKQSKEELTCNVATAVPYIGTCTKVTLAGDCSGCVSGCECGTEKWLEEANKICASFGDCGAYVNIVGEVTDGGYESWVGKNEDKRKEGIRLNDTYLNSLKKLTEEITNEDAIIRYKNISWVNWTGIIGRIKVGSAIPSPGFLGRIWNFIKGIFTFQELRDFSGFVSGIFGEGCDIKKTYYHYTCLPYQAPVGGENCHLCNNNEKKCSEYRCKSLGQACEFLNEGTGNEVCEWINKNDSSPPKISPWEEILPEETSYEKETCSSSLGCYKLKGTEEDNCIKPYTYYSLGVKADEASQCKIDFNHTSNFEEMESYLGDNAYLKEHFSNISFPSSGHIYESLGVNISNEFSFYIRCRDKNGNENKDELNINLCVDEGEDKNPVRIVRTIPENNGYVAFGTEEIEVGFYINEPAECKFSLLDKSYNDMENSMNCSTSILDAEPDFTYLCSDTLNLAGNSSKFYFRCKDQPWLTAGEEGRRNIMTESYVYNLQKSLSELKIDKAEPEGEKISGVEPMSITLKVTTSGGAENGKAICSFVWNGQEIDFFKTNDDVHIQENWNFNRGRHIIYVRCEDVASNKAEGEINFKVNIDNTPPKVIRVYNAGVLKIITDEDAECVFSHKNCNYIFENATQMSGFQLEHDATWERGQTYYIKCMDLWENKPKGCSITVKAV